MGPPNPGGGSDSSNALGYTYSYNQYGEGNTGRPDFADSLYDSTLDRSWTHDHVGRLKLAYTGKEANLIWGSPDGPYAHGYNYDVWGNITSRTGWGGWNATDSASYVNNRHVGMQYDAAGNVLGDNYSTFTYDANGQPASSQYYSTSLQMSYDGNGLRAKKVENSAPTYYLRSRVLGGQVVAEISGSGTWTRGYVYLGGQLLALQSNGAVTWVHQEPYTKGQRLTNSSGSVTALLEFDPFGGEVGSWASGTRSTFNTQQQPHKYTSYDRDANYWDEAGARIYHGWWSRFAQPDPYDGSYDFSDPQSFNRYAYVQNDPVNFVDPSGLLRVQECTRNWWSGSDGERHYSSWMCVTIYDDGGGSVPQDSGQQFLTDGLDEARRRLQDAECAKLFGGEKKALKRLAELKFKFGSLDNGRIAQIKGTNVTLDSNRFSAQGATLTFATNIRPSTVQGHPATSFTSRTLTVTGSTFGAFALLHELGHRSKIYGQYDKDGGSQYDNLPTGANNEKVRAGCFGEL